MISFRIILLSSFLLASYQAEGAENKSVGIVLATQGTVTAKDLEGKLRNLARRSDIFVGDVIDIGPSGKAQLRFSDASLLTLAQGTNFRVDDYKFQDKPGDTFLSKLAKGGLRALPGAVEKNAPGVSVNTPVAVMGVRGTLLSFVTTQDGTAIGFFQGAGWLQNPKASIELGNNQRFDFAVIGVSEKAKPQGKIPEPKLLGLLEYDAPEKRVAIEERVSSFVKDAHILRSLSDDELQGFLSEIDKDGAFVSDPMLKLLDYQVELRSEAIDCH